MYCIGANGSYQISSITWFASEITSTYSILDKHFSKETDYISLEKEVFIQIIKDLQSRLDYLISLTNNDEINKSPKFRYYEYFIDVYNVTILVDRIGEQKEIPITSELLCIFQRALNNSNSFYLYYLPCQIYDKYIEIFKNCILNAVDLTELDISIQIELLSFKLAYKTNEDKLYPTHKFIKLLLRFA